MKEQAFKESIIKKTVYYLVPFAVIFIDQLIKSLFLKHLKTSDLLLSFFHIKIHFNYGVFLGILSDSNPFLLAVFHSLLAICFIPVFLFTIYFLPSERKILRASISVFFASLLSNSLDRIIYGGVVDYINIKKTSGYFNLADIFLICSLLIIILDLFKRDELEKSGFLERTKLIINKNFQIKFLLFFYIFIFTLGLVFILFFFFFYHFFFARLPEDYLNYSNLILGVGIQTLLLFLFSTISGFFILRYSHSIAGPIFALNRYLDQDTALDNIYFREKDEFKKELLNIASRIKKD